MQAPTPAPPPDPAATTAPRQGATNNYGGNNTTRTAEVSIGAISIQTAATDAAGLARDLAPALRRASFVEQATVGLV